MEKAIVAEFSKREDKLTQFEKVMYYITESYLIIGGIPAVILFFLATVTSLIQIIDYDEYETCINRYKTLKILTGGSTGDVPNMLWWHLLGSAIC